MTQENDQESISSVDRTWEELAAEVTRQLLGDSLRENQIVSGEELDNRRRQGEMKQREAYALEFRQFTPDE